MKSSYKVNSSEVDVLIVGAGPTGLMAAANLLRLGFSIRIIDKSTGPTEIGRAAYFQPRTCEILDQIGIVEKFLAEAYAFHKVSFYEDGKLQGIIDYSDKINSEFPYMYIYGQAGVEKILIRDLEKHGVEVSRSTHLVDFEVQERNIVAERNGMFAKAESYQVVATLRNVSGESETIFAKYMIGADGAHSFVRRKLSLDSDGVENTVQEVHIDAEIESDIPDMENAIMISRNGKSAYYIPRAKRNGHWHARFVITLSDIGTHSKHPAVFEEAAIEQAKLIFAPYTLTFKSVEWCYIYEVTGHVISTFIFYNCVFMAGDSCHCHVSKQGVNLAIADSHNLCWKLFWYEKVRLGNSMLLDSYTIERRAVAQYLVEVNSRVSLVSAGIADSTGLNSSYSKEMSYVLSKYIATAHGCGITYDEGSAIMKESDIVFGGNFKVTAGQRAPFGNLINADGKTVRLSRLFTPDNVPSRFTLLVLLDSIAEHLDEFTLFTEWIRDFKNNLASKTIVPVQSLIGIIVAQTEIFETSLLACDQLFHDNDGELRRKYGASDDEPAIFVIRPDGYIGTAWLLSEVSGVEAYFRQILNI